MPSDHFLQSVNDYFVCLKMPTTFYIKLTKKNVIHLLEGIYDYPKKADERPGDKTKHFSSSP